MSEQRFNKSFHELRFRDDFMFGKVMEDPELCRDVLECLLQHPVGDLTEVQMQREFRYTFEGKPIRLDVYNEDAEGTVYDAEMENLNHKTVENHQLPKRSRFYQGSIDVDFLDKGNSYKKLPESNVIFICTFDPFGKGLSKYTFTERCKEFIDIELGDDTTKIFFNCTYKGNDIPADLRNFYNYVERGQVKGELTKRIDDAVVQGRRNEVWRTQYMKEWVVIQDAREEGIEQGIRQVIESMLKKGKTVDEIVEFSGLSYKQVKVVEESICSTTM